MSNRELMMSVLRSLSRADLEQFACAAHTALMINTTLAVAGLPLTDITEALRSGMLCQFGYDDAQRKDSSRVVDDVWKRLQSAASVGLNRCTRRGC